MKVGVFLGDIAPTEGGGFTFQDDIFQALLTLESKHTFVVFSFLGDDQTKELIPEHIQSVCLKRSFWESALSASTNIASSAIQKVPIIRNWFPVNQKNWLKQTVAKLGIDFMWFVVPVHIAVDVPFIFTVWDLQHRLQPWFPEVSANGQWWLRERMYADLLPRAAAIIIGAEAGKAEIVDFYRVPPERVKLVPHPTPRFAFTASRDSGQEVLSKYRIPEGYILYPSQFWPHKNHVGLLLAVKLLREEYGLIFPVVFVGSDQGNLHYVRQVVGELGLSAQVHFLGFVPRQDLVGLYHNALALTYLTFFGPENLPPLEAFALGCPVIASNVSGAQEQLGDAALLVDPVDEEQIASAIKSLHDDSALRESLVSRGRARASKWTAEDFLKECGVNT